MKCGACGLIECNSPQANYVRIGYVEGKPTSIGIYSSFGDSDVDLKRIVQLSETNTHIELNKTDRSLDYYQELWLSSEGHQGCINEICLVDVFALMHLNEIGDVKVPNPHSGETIIYNEATKSWEPYDLVGEIGHLQDQIDVINEDLRNFHEDFNNFQTQVQNQFTQVNARINSLGDRISAIENAIYNWANDKNTKIARGNINITSGATNSSKGIFTHDGQANDDLNFQ